MNTKHGQAWQTDLQRVANWSLASTEASAASDRRKDRLTLQQRSTFGPAMKNHKVQMYSFLTVCICFQVLIFRTTTTVLSPHYLTHLSSHFFPLQSRSGRMPMSRETKSGLHKANDNTLLEVQNCSRSVNSQQRPLQFSIPIMLKLKLVPICLHGLCVWLKKSTDTRRKALQLCIINSMH